MKSLLLRKNFRHLLDPVFATHLFALLFLAGHLWLNFKKGVITVMYYKHSLVQFIFKIKLYITKFK